MDSGELDLVTKMYKIQLTVFKMLSDRGYDIPKEKLEMTMDTFRSAYVVDLGSGVIDVDYGKLHSSWRMRDDLTKLIMVFFCPELKMSVKTLELYHAAMSGEISCSSAIIVLRGIPSPPCKTKIAELQIKEKRHFEIFKESELVVDITQHILVPKHIVLPESERIKVLER